MFFPLNKGAYLEEATAGNKVRSRQLEKLPSEGMLVC